MRKASRGQRIVTSLWASLSLSPAHGEPLKFDRPQAPNGWRRHEQFGPIGCALEPRKPGDASDAMIVETMDDLAHPLHRAIDQGADAAIGHAAGRQENDPGMTTVPESDLQG